jgi:hypothetical protein
MASQHALDLGSVGAGIPTPKKDTRHSCEIGLQIYAVLKNTNQNWIGIGAGVRLGRRCLRQVWGVFRTAQPSRPRPDRSTSEKAPDKSLRR